MLKEPPEQTQKKNTQQTQRRGLGGGALARGRAWGDEELVAEGRDAAGRLPRARGRRDEVAVRGPGREARLGGGVVGDVALDDDDVRVVRAEGALEGREGLGVEGLGAVEVALRAEDGRAVREGGGVGGAGGADVVLEEGAAAGVEGVGGVVLVLELRREPRQGRLLRQARLRPPRRLRRPAVAAGHQGPRGGGGPRTQYDASDVKGCY